MEKIGVMGGTFDPVHYGHLCLAEEAMIQGNLSKVILVPAKLQPFKLNQEVASAQHRTRMLELSAVHRPWLEISDFELQSKEVSYTINTLRAMKAQFGDVGEIFFIIGADAFSKIRIWKDAENILSEYSFMVGSRPGYGEEDVDECIREYTAVYNTNIIKINNIQVPISSTDIRAKLKMGEALSKLVPEEVERYIKKHGLYTGIY